MKKLFFILALTSVALFAANGMGRGQGKGRGFGNGNRRGYGRGYNQNNQERPCLQTKDSKKYNLTKEQKDALLFMYEEEKLARDIYIKMGEKWNLRPFLNIQKAEQRHMDSIKYLLDKYSLKVPVKNDTGIFKNEEIKKLYAKLLEKGLKSEKDALEVGKLIEETDIKDLDKRLNNTTPDVKTVFEQLRRGSENHLRAFNRFL